MRSHSQVILVNFWRGRCFFSTCRLSHLGTFCRIQGIIIFPDPFTAPISPPATPHPKIWGSQPMFPLSCARVCMHIGCETSAHKKTRSAHKSHKCSLQKCVFHIHTSFQTQMSSGKILHKGNFMHTQTLKN